jgi:hypothetical protein
MMSGVIRGGGQNCSLEVLVILTSGFASPGKYKPLKRRGKEEAGIGIAKSPELPKIAKIEKHTTNILTVNSLHHSFARTGLHNS